MEVLSGYQWSERISALTKGAGTQAGGWRTALLSRLADAHFSIPMPPAPKPSDPEVRRLRLYHVHTRESLTVTYKRDGRYIPAAMARLDHFFRDWRTNTVVNISGETIDLLWELHNELGSKQPILVICGFRSAQTNALLNRIGAPRCRSRLSVKGRSRLNSEQVRSRRPGAAVWQPHPKRRG